MPETGRFVVFEGPEGAGKSSHLHRIAGVLREEGYEVVVTREPGGTRLGAAIRDLLLHREEAPVPMAELLLYLADRAQHVETVLRPALARGAVVLCDRFAGSTYAYQGYGRGLDLVRMAEVDAWARGGLNPDLVILLDCPVATGLGRARGGDRFHGEDEAFHERVRAGFLALAAADPLHWRVVNADRPVEAVHAEVLAHVRRVLPPRGQPR